jgi:hypothetical protein
VKDERRAALIEFLEGQAAKATIEDPISTLKFRDAAKMIALDYYRGTHDPAIPDGPLGRRADCGNEQCGCHEPSFSTPEEAVRFLYDRFRAAGVSAAVAYSYAQDLEILIDRMDAPSE